MSDIYEGAYLTVAAALAADDEVGFLHATPERGGFQGQDLQFDFQGETLQSIQTRKVHDIRTHDVIEPLWTRGWTLQERLLSKRLLTFTSGVTFECATASICECGHSIYSNPLYPGLDQQRRLDRKEFRTLIASESPNNELLHTYWAEFLVRHYSTLALTKDSDRLPAIHSLAMILERKLGDEYVSGLWKSDLLRGIRWIAADNFINIGPTLKQTERVIRRLPEVNRAPSWSWTSVEGAMNRLIPANWTCDVVAVGQDGVKGESLTLKAPLIEMSIIMETPFDLGCRKFLQRIDVPSSDYNDMSSVLFTFDTLVDMVPALKSDGEDYMSLQRSHQRSEYPEAYMAANIFALKLGTVVGDDRIQDFLVLGGLMEPPGAYQRIGYLSLRELDTDFETWKGELPIYEVTIY